MKTTKKEAQVAGDKYYFTGKTCKRGHVSKRFTSDGSCVQCGHERMRSQERKEYDKTKYAKDKDKWREAQLMRTYGIDLAEYNKMHEAQNGCCSICGKHEDEQDKSLAVDHCHTTGKVRSLLCKACNTALGNVNDNPIILEKMIAYLEDNRL